MHSASVFLAGKLLAVDVRAIQGLVMPDALLTTVLALGNANSRLV